MKERGYVDGRNIIYEFNHVNWQRNLIPQMLAKIEASRPDVIVTLTTPVTQAAVRAIRDKSIPVVFAAVQDPVTAGVVPSWDKAGDGITGASNPTDMDFSRDGRFLYVLAPDQTMHSSPGINVFRVHPGDGSLEPLPGVSGLAGSVDGLVAR